jgi:hypothetical protein
MSENILYFGPAIFASLAGLAIAVLGMQKRRAVSAIAFLSAAAPWLFLLLCEPRFKDFGTSPKWFAGFISLFSIFGCAATFLSLVLILIFSKEQDQKRRMVSLSISGLIAGILHSLAILRILDGLGSV